MENIQSIDFTKARVLVVGDIMLDRYWFGNTSRVSPEAPIPIIKVQKMENRLGGAANVASNIVALGGQATLLGLVGQDEAADSLEQLLEISGVIHHMIRVQDKPTIVKLRALSQNQQLLRIDFEEYFDEEEAYPLLRIFEKKLDHVDVVILVDYAKGTLKRADDFIALAKLAHVPVLVDPKSVDFNIYRGATLVKPNMKEFQAAVGCFSSEDEMASKARKLMRTSGIGSLLITRGKDGMSLFPGVNEEPVHIPTMAKEVFDITGAGDTAIGVLAIGLAIKRELLEAVKIANLAAGIVVGKLGTSVVNEYELLYAMHEIPLQGILDEDRLLLTVQQARSRGEKIVMTNGCFDILHAGHVYYLEQARKLGDRLIIAVNDDESTTRLKGEGRPINSLNKRLPVLAGLKSVDWVVPFSEDTPARIIGKILPDILVKGSDYRVEQIAGADTVLAHGGEVKLIDLVDGVSTTLTINNIKKQEEK